MATRHHFPNFEHDHVRSTEIIIRDGRYILELGASRSVKRDAGIIKDIQDAVEIYMRENPRLREAEFVWLD